LKINGTENSCSFRVRLRSVHGDFLTFVSFLEAPQAVFCRSRFCSSNAVVGGFLIFFGLSFVLKRRAAEPMPERAARDANICAGSIIREPFFAGRLFLESDPQLLPPPFSTGMENRNSAWKGIPALCGRKRKTQNRKSKKASFEKRGPPFPVKDNGF
jgi:hypothetical protein